MYVCIYLFIYLLVGNLEVMCYFDQKKKVLIQTNSNETNASGYS